MAKLVHANHIPALLRDLSLISQGMRLCKKGDKVEIKQNSGSGASYISLTFPHTDFAFTGDSEGKIGFVNFPEFYAIYNSFGGDQSIDEAVAGTLLTISGGQSTFKYRLSPAQTVRGTWESVDVPEWDVTLDLTKDTLKLIRASVGLIQAKTLRVSMTPEDPNHLILTSLPETGENEWRYVFPTEVECQRSFSFSLPLESFAQIPMMDYKFSASKDELVCFEGISDLYELVIYGLPLAVSH